MADAAAADGILQMVATPHIFNGISRDPGPAEVLERVAALQSAIGGRLKILPGNEVHISHEIVEQARENRVTKINRKKPIRIVLEVVRQYSAKAATRPPRSLGRRRPAVWFSTTRRPSSKAGRLPPKRLFPSSRNVPYCPASLIDSET